MWLGVPAAFAAVPSGVETVDATADEASARQLFALLNQDRIQAGLPPLAWDEGLAAAAHKHAQLMVRNNQLSHQMAGEPPLHQRLAAVLLDLSGENVAVDTSIPTADTNLINSPPHRANILSPKFNAVGVGIVWNDSQVWVVQDFARLVKSMSQEDAANIVAATFARSRTDAGLPPLERTSDTRLSSLACEMGRDDRVNTEKALNFPEVQMATAYTTSDPAELSTGAAQTALQRRARSYGVGVCLERTPTYPSGVYWVLLVLFAR
jgi:hypothetical protein